MKDNISYELRNRIVEEHLHCINTVIWQNWSLVQAARLERDDVYQQLAIRLIRCVDTYDPSKGPLKKRIYAQLKYELLNCKEVRRLTGITGPRRCSVAGISSPWTPSGRTANCIRNIWRRSERSHHGLADHKRRSEHG